MHYRFICMRVKNCSRVSHSEEEKKVHWPVHRDFAIAEREYIYIYTIYIRKYTENFLDKAREQ